ncbi:hypothetical protein [Pseudoalteromonas phenolica]|uniref:hypothetical protein n=1 Tax=Pseudoalteromonas phenolica TaxID=161398 RepID=UPI001029BFB4|nr:hypothetical protein [Pseudoalteromonas phenolica]
MSSNVTLRDILDFLYQFFLGTMSRKLFSAGMALLMAGIPGMIDAVTYGTSLYFSVKAEPPAPVFEWPQYIGSLFIVTSTFIKLRQYFVDRRNNLTEEKTKFKETWRELSDERLVDEFERLYGVKNAGLTTIKNILSHKEYKNRVIYMFEVCHMHVEAQGSWLKLIDKWIRARKNFSYTFSLLSIILAIFTIIMIILEILRPGSTNSGTYALYPYCILLFAIVIATIVIIRDSSSMGTAITLVKKYHPNNFPS